MTISLPGSVRLRPHTRDGFIDVSAAPTAAAAGIPASIPGLQGWWEADTGTSTTTNGAAVSSWTDQSGNGRTLAQATGSKQPLFIAAGMNGLPVVRFDGVDDDLGYAPGADWLTTTTLTVFAVRRRIATTANPGCAVSLAPVGVSDFSTVGGVVVQYEAADVVLQDYRSVARSTATHPGNGVAYQATSKFDGSFDLVYLNGVAQANSASSGGFAVRNMLIGGRLLPAASSWANSDYAALLIYNTALSNTDRAAVETYLKAKWGTP